MANGYAQIIWDYLLEKIGNECGVAGLMGNLDAESGLHPDRVQGDVPYSEYSVQYTADVDRGVISEEDFVHNGPNGGGYGLAQWTYHTRKQALYDWYKYRGYSSIGCIELALDYLWHELQYSFPAVLDILCTAKTVREASNVVLHDFENPAVQDEEVENVRTSMGEVYYTLFTGKTPPTGKRKSMPIWMMCRRRF